MSGKGMSLLSRVWTKTLATRAISVVTTRNQRKSKVYGRRMQSKGGCSQGLGPSEGFGIVPTEPNVSSGYQILLGLRWFLLW